jgi:hypothetical protein
MTCCTGFVYGSSPWLASSAMSGPPAGPWDPSLDLLPLEAAAGPARPRDPATSGTTATQDGESDQSAGRAAGDCLRSGPSRLRAGPHRRRTRPAPLGWDPAVSQWGLAGAGSPRPQHPGQALRPGRWICRPTRTCAVNAAAGAAPGCRHPGQLVQLDCFCIGRLSGTKGTVWQYTAIDVASAYTWATLQVTRRNPQPPGPAPSPAPSRPTWPPAAGSWSGS